MIVSKSKKMMTKNFKKTTYKFNYVPDYHFEEDYGIYIHVPFCYSKCAFCPFYKELYSGQLKDDYLKAIHKEIKQKDINGKPKWIYIGGGTPNTLSIDEIDSILKELRNKIILPDVGIELLPAKLDKNYLDGLKDIGIKKISLGVESFSNEIMSKTNRKISEYQNIKELIEYSKKIGLWVTLDIMIGLNNQTEENFLNDIDKILEIMPNQLTIYPTMNIRGSINTKQTMDDAKKFSLIERAFSEKLEPNGYKRKTIWTFGLDSKIYDSSKDELIQDYVGFGPASFSTYGHWKVVNPPLNIYISNILNNEKRKALISEKQLSTDDWRRFASMIYECRCENSEDFPRSINFFIKVLRLFGYARKGLLTEKGKYFSHNITKTVVESLPFPIQDTKSITNVEEYMEYQKICKEKKETLIK